MSHTQSLPHDYTTTSLVIAGFVASVVLAGSGHAQQVVYYSPVVAQPAPYVSQYPVWHIFGVTAYSAPVAAVPASSVAVTSYYAPATTAYYAPLRLLPIMPQQLRTMLQQPHITPTAAYYAQPRTLLHTITAGASSAVIVLHAGWPIGLLSGLLIDNSPSANQTFEFAKP